ncbi:hypothetical protein BT93_E1105 [Corymbia citriodora subsp. variegata]|nr:hypothetical protein BT93_E1105 [Corymbia citriodora subsp. variegata]
METRQGSWKTFSSGNGGLKIEERTLRSCGVNQCLVTLAFAGVEVNLVLFSKLVLRQTNEEVANTFSRWDGAMYFCSLLGAFLNDCHLGRYFTCIAFQALLIIIRNIGLLVTTLWTWIFLLEPDGCGKLGELCNPHTLAKIAIFYVSIYLMAVGYGGSEPALVALGLEQFDEDDPKENQFKTNFYSYYYVVRNLGCLVSETVLAYIESRGHWTLAFWICTSCAIVAYLSLLSGTKRYKHIRPTPNNPISRFSRVVVASIRKMNLEVPRNGKAPLHNHSSREVKCIFWLMPIWLCTVMSSAIFVPMLALFVEQGAAMDTTQGAAMDTTVSGFHISPASMTVFDIVSTFVLIILYNKLIFSALVKLIKQNAKELQRIGIGLAIAIAALLSARLVEQQRLRHAGTSETSSLSIFWQAPQYVLLGLSEAFAYVAQMEFFVSQSPDGLKSIRVGLSMASLAIGCFAGSFLLTIVMDITTRNGGHGWVPQSLNDGHLDRFFFLSAMLTLVILSIFAVCAKRYKSIVMAKRDGADEVAEL